MSERVKMAGGKEVLRPKDRDDWRRWPEANRSSSPGVWLELSEKGARHKGIVYVEALPPAPQKPMVRRQQE